MGLKSTLFHQNWRFDTLNASHTSMSRMCTWLYLTGPLGHSDTDTMYFKYCVGGVEWQFKWSNLFTLWKLSYSKIWIALLFWFLCCKNISVLDVPIKLDTTFGGGSPPVAVIHYLFAYRIERTHLSGLQFHRDNENKMGFLPISKPQFW